VLHLFCDSEISRKTDRFALSPNLIIGVKVLGDEVLTVFERIGKKFLTAGLTTPKKD
jgi:hypothetical protein